MAKVLVIDDDNTILTAVEVILEGANYTSVTALSGKEGLKKVRADRPDAIILDRQMPEMDGNQVLIELKANDNTRDIPVIMLTKDNRIGDVSCCLELGAVDYIVKPFDSDNFLMRLSKALKDAQR
ncbi:MAG: response regulator [Alphaproteobacteria bacterium]|nr:response regulator [Alphaproteobacteria bacterium]